MTRQTLILILTIIQIKVLFGNPLVTLPTGTIRGRIATIEGKTFYIFQKIPYAKPPIGELRFKPPQPAEKWDGVLDATRLDVVCYQIASNSDLESEDCLFINVYTPKLPSRGCRVALPVLVYIHGGGFVGGSSANFTGDRFVNQDVVFVSMNYRVGIFGFISTQDEVIPGNNGLKDQNFALQWIQKNIHLFGGNPQRVTIYGESSGGGSVGYHLLNQRSVGLFRGGILSSNSALSPGAFQRRAREIAFATASLLNSTFETSSDSRALLEYLQSVEAKDLDSAAARYNTMIFGIENLGILQGFTFAPVVEVECPDAFLTEKMYVLLREGKVVPVPILIGINSEEAVGIYPDPNGLLAVAQDFDKRLNLLVPNDMRIVNETDRIEMGRLIRNIYTGGEPLANHLGDTVRYFSDSSITRSTIKHAELHSKVAKTYFYQFSYDGQLGNGNIHYDGAESVGHAEELKYIFCSGSSCDISGYPESDQTVQKRLVEIICNFVKYLNPTPEPSELLQGMTWPTVSTDKGDFFYVDIGSNLEIRNHPKNNSYGGWVELYDSLPYDDFDTY